MFSFIKRLLGGNTTDVNYAELVKNGAIVVDVRTTGEYASGHIQGSVNIPLDQLTKNLNKLKDKEKTIITCCASGMRSASAIGILKSNGYTNVHNGGGWSGLNSKLKG